MRLMVCGYMEVCNQGVPRPVSMAHFQGAVHVGGGGDGDRN